MTPALMWLEVLCDAFTAHLRLTSNHPYNQSICHLHQIAGYCRAHDCYCVCGRLLNCSRVDEAGEMAGVLVWALTQ